jgi:aconitate hydratase
MGRRSQLALADRAPSPTCRRSTAPPWASFPVDAATLDYLRLSGRAPEHVALVEAYCKEQGLFRSADTPDPVFSGQLSLDLSTVEPSLAGPKRPQDRVALSGMKAGFHAALAGVYKRDADAPRVEVRNNGDPSRWRTARW